jgi:Skp family chaperone for outer membrane proteins
VAILGCGNGFLDAGEPTARARHAHVTVVLARDAAALSKGRELPAHLRALLASVNCSLRRGGFSAKYRPLLTPFRISHPWQSARAVRHSGVHEVRKTVPNSKECKLVTRSFCLTALAAGLCVLHTAAPRAAAQPRQPAQAAPQIALVDLAYIFQNHIRFKALSEDLRRDVEAAEAELKQNKQTLQKMADSLEQFNRNSPEYRQIEEDIAKRTADIQVQVQKQKRDFFEQEAKMYYNVYQEVMEQVKYYADKHGIMLVMRFNGDPYDENDPQALQKELNKAVLYHNKTIDITPIILDAVNPSRQNNHPASQPPRDRLSTPQGVPPNATNRR